MIKYSFEQKKALVTAYLNGEGGIRTVIKKQINPYVKKILDSSNCCVIDGGIYKL